MLRVAQLDSQILDTEITNIFWSQIQKNLIPDINKFNEELKLLSDTFVFLFATKVLFKNIRATNTYGSKLSGISYNCSKKRLFLSSVLANYIIKKLSHFVFSNSQSYEFSENLVMIKVFNILNLSYKFLDLTYLCQFITKANSKIYLSLLDRLLSITCTLTNNNPQSKFFDNTRLASMEFQNRQLLWNAILELLNIIILPNSHLLMSKVTNNDAQTFEKNACPLCHEVPCNPYQISCCHETYCYICVVKVLEWKRCRNCSASTNLEACSIYN